MTNEQLEEFLKATTAAQSMLLAAVLRPLLANGIVSEQELAASLDATEQAAMQRRSPETPALTGLIDLLRRDLGLGAANRPGA
jgi:hypothetical protein